MDNLEKVEVEEIIPSIPNLNSIYDWVSDHLFEIVLVLCFLALVFYKYGKKEISMASNYKSILEQVKDNINHLFGSFWLSSNMEGKAIKSSVSFNEDDNEEYSDDEYEEEKKQSMYI
jgi:hypothetical protein